MTNAYWNPVNGGGRGVRPVDDPRDSRTDLGGNLARMRISYMITENASVPRQSQVTTAISPPGTQSAWSAVNRAGRSMEFAPCNTTMNSLTQISTNSGTHSDSDMENASSGSNSPVEGDPAYLQDRQRWSTSDQIAALYFYVVPEPPLSWEEIREQYAVYIEEFVGLEGTLRSVSALQSQVYRLEGEWGIIKTRNGETDRRVINRQRFRRGIARYAQQQVVRGLRDRFGPSHFQI